jgi:hypothetical protein
MEGGREKDVFQVFCQSVITVASLDKRKNNTGSPYSFSKSNSD